MNVEAVQGLIPLLVPVLIYLTRQYLPKIPKTLYPILAPILGAGMDVVMYYAGAVATSNPVLGAALGGLGTWLREVVDQVRKAATGVPIVVLAITAAALSGCMAMAYQPQTIAEWQAMTKALDGSGCFYARGNARPYADASVLVISTWGKNAPKYLECLEAIPGEARSFLRGEP